MTKKSKGKGSQMVATRLTDAEAEALQKIAVENKTTVSEIIRQALSQYGLEVRANDVLVLTERIDASAKVQEFMIARIVELEERMTGIAQLYQHLAWSTDDEPKIMNIEGKNIKAFPLFWVRAVKRS